jgi:hypothetical protein
MLNGSVKALKDISTSSEMSVTADLALCTQADGENEILKSA